LEVDSDLSIEVIGEPLDNWFQHFKRDHSTLFYEREHIFERHTCLREVLCQEFLHLVSQLLVGLEIDGAVCSDVNLSSGDEGEFLDERLPESPVVVHHGDESVSRLVIESRLGFTLKPL
jgi:hypothetical protein